MNPYVVVLSNLSVIPCIVYYLHHKKYVYALQIGLNAAFSLIHHLLSTGLLLSDEIDDLFLFIDAFYSYLSIYVFSIYFFLSLSPSDLVIESSLFHAILLPLVFINIDFYYLISVIIGWILLIIGLHLHSLRPMFLCNPYLYLVLCMCIGDLSCYLIAIKNNYNLFHSLHHLIAFTLPISVDICIHWQPIDLDGL